MKRRAISQIQRLVSLTGLAAALIAAGSRIGVGATLCVNPTGKAGCFSAIGAAVAKAADNDTIDVAKGTYKEDIVIGKSLSLIGTNQKETIIDATGFSNGIYVDGIDNEGLSRVLVSGLTVENANLEGILIANASSVLIVGNTVQNNEKGVTATPPCPGLPAFETEEPPFDCGEGVHLTGVDHSTVANNVVRNNAGGILISDDTGANHDNLISGNLVHDNRLDCGITLASHPPASLTGSTSPLGVFRNTVAGNESFRNGLGVRGAGAGVGIFSGATAGTVSRNLIINNKLMSNGLPGVAFHGHAPGDHISDNVVVGNHISRNGPDTQDAATSGPTGINIFGISAITGTVISQNVINEETIDIVVNTASNVDVNLNDLLGKNTGVQSLSPKMVNATENWWGCRGGPGTRGCSSVSGSGTVLFSPFLTNPF